MGYWDNDNDNDNDYWSLRDEQNNNHSGSYADNDYDEISSEKMLDTSSAANMVFWWDD